VISDQGCASIFTSNVNIFPTPSVAFTSNDPCLGDPSQFYNQTTVQGGISFTSLWDFGGGNTSAINNPTVTYTTSGPQSVTLTATSANGCTSALTQTADVHDIPQARFAAGDNCLGQSTAFTDQSISNDGAIASWHWQFGDNTTSNMTSPQHTYSNTGNFGVDL